MTDRKHPRKALMRLVDILCGSWITPYSRRSGRWPARSVWRWRCAVCRMRLDAHSGRMECAGPSRPSGGSPAPMLSTRNRWAFSPSRWGRLNGHERAEYIALILEEV